METIVFDLPKHPRNGKQQIVLEKPAPDSVWHLVIAPNKYKPLVGFDKPPTSAKEVLDEFAKEYGKDNVAQFVIGGFSKT